MSQTTQPYPHNPKPTGNNKTTGRQ